MGLNTGSSELERILQFSDAMGMVVCITLFKKEYSKLITYQSEHSDGQENRSLSIEGCECDFM